MITQVQSRSYAAPSFRNRTHGFLGCSQRGSGSNRSETLWASRRRQPRVKYQFDHSQAQSHERHAHHSRGKSKQHHQFGIMEQQSTNLGQTSLTKYNPQSRIGLSGPRHYGVASSRSVRLVTSAWKEWRRSSLSSAGAGRIRLQFGVPRRRRGGSQLQFDAKLIRRRVQRRGRTARLPRPAVQEISRSTAVWAA